VSATANQRKMLAKRPGDILVIKMLSKILCYTCKREDHIFIRKRRIATTSGMYSFIISCNRTHIGSETTCTAPSSVVALILFMLLLAFSRVLIPYIVHPLVQALSNLLLGLPSLPKRWRNWFPVWICREWAMEVMSNSVELFSLAGIKLAEYLLRSCPYNL
jgi:hypothetical protein